MKLEIYEEKKVEEDKVVRIQLRRDRGRVFLVVVDEKGLPLTNGNILCFRSEGDLHLMPGINPDIGLDLDDEGRIKIED